MQQGDLTSLRERDPRREPRPGDISRNRNGEEFKVVKRHGDLVCYLSDGNYEETDIDCWVEYAANDEVLHAAK